MIEVEGIFQMTFMSCPPKSLHALLVYHVLSSIKQTMSLYFNVISIHTGVEQKLLSPTPNQ
jgi:hypothetical protein